MNKTQIILILTALLLGCGRNAGDYYFDFDEIDHYSIQIVEKELFDRVGEPNLTKEQQFEQDLIIGDIPTSTSDTLFLLQLENKGFTKNTITGKEIQPIKEIFREKYHKETVATSCVAVYRDLLIFKKKGQIVGTAKICFGCSYHQIHGTNANTFQFGQSGDYVKLEALLHKN